jgi:hypothetical protein
MRKIGLSLVSCFATFHAAINSRTLTKEPRDNRGKAKGGSAAEMRHWAG